MTQEEASLDEESSKSGEASSQEAAGAESSENVPTGRSDADPETVPAGQPDVSTESLPEEQPDMDPETVSAGQPDVRPETASTGQPDVDPESVSAEQILSEMTVEEKVLQLFMVTPEALTGYETVTAAGDHTRESIVRYPVGGIIYFAQNLQTPEQVKEMLGNTSRYYEEAGYPAPFLAVDEEGGQVARIGKQAVFGVERIGDMRTVGDQGDPGEASRIGNVIGSYLSELGFTLDFAPVADVLTDPDNKVIGNRSFGTDPSLVTDMVLAEARGLEDAGVWAVLKHYPGHGATRSDSHEGYAYTEKTLEELLEAELIPFQAGIREESPLSWQLIFLCRRSQEMTFPAAFLLI